MLLLATLKWGKGGGDLNTKVLRGGKKKQTLGSLSTKGGKKKPNTRNLAHQGGEKKKPNTRTLAHQGGGKKKPNTNPFQNRHPNSKNFRVYFVELTKEVACVPELFEERKVEKLLFALPGSLLPNNFTPTWLPESGFCIQMSQKGTP